MLVLTLVLLGGGTVILSLVFGWTLNLFFTVVGVLALGSALNLYWALVLKR